MSTKDKLKEHWRLLAFAAICIILNVLAVYGGHYIVSILSIIFLVIGVCVHALFESITTMNRVGKYYGREKRKDSSDSVK